MLLDVTDGIATVTDVILPVRLVAVSPAGFINIGRLEMDGSLAIPKMADGTYEIAGIAEDYSVTNLVEYTATGAHVPITGTIPQNLPVWIYASVIKYFQTALPDLYLHLDTLQRELNLPNWYELRVDGPVATQMDKFTWSHLVEINALVTTRRDTSNLYNCRQLMGLVASAFPRTMMVYKYGSTPADDGSLVGCLQRTSGRREALYVSYFGLKPNGDIEQAGIEDHYVLELEEQ